MLVHCSARYIIGASNGLSEFEFNRFRSMDAQHPPRSPSASQPDAASNEPPPYISPTQDSLTHPVTPRVPTEHRFHLNENNRNVNWVTLKLYSRAKSSTSLPVYFERENINGSLEINAEKGDSISSLTAKVGLSA